MAGGLNIFETIRADLTKARNDDATLMGRDAHDMLVRNIYVDCNKGWATGNLMNNAYGRHQGRGVVVFGVSANAVNSNGVSYAEFVNNGTGSVVGKRMAFEKDGQIIVFNSRVGTPAAHFMEHTLRDLSSKWGSIL